MGRPAGYQWRPLGLDSDPVPGDPAQISQEAQHLASVASQITDQVAALRKVGSDNSEVGQHADKIRSSASSLADQLDMLVGRYTKVSAALNSWVPELEQAQAMSIQALDQAEGPYQKVSQNPPPPSGPDPTILQQQDLQNYNSSMKQAQAGLAAAQALLAKATTLRDNAASTCANAINNACNDGLRDHWSLWGSIESWVGSQFDWITQNWSKLLADLCSYLELIAAILAIAAFIIAQFIPGLDVLVDGIVLASMILTGEALAGRIALAATGHGSWMDVAVDAFALATFGMGRLAGAAAKSLVPGMEAGSKLALQGELITSWATDTTRGAMMAKFADLMGMSKVAMAQKLAQEAPDLANGAKLQGFTKVMANLGFFGNEEEAYTKLITLGERFSTPTADLGSYATMAKVLGGISGVGAGMAGLTVTTANVLNGWSTNFMGTLDIPSVHKWYMSTFETPTGMPASG
jgi:hypothetical protein